MDKKKTKKRHKTFTFVEKRHWPWHVLTYWFKVFLLRPENALRRKGLTFAPSYKHFATGYCFKYLVWKAVVFIKYKMRAAPVCGGCLTRNGHNWLLRANKMLRDSKDTISSHPTAADSWFTRKIKIHAIWTLVNTTQPFCFAFLVFIKVNIKQFKGQKDLF